MRAALLAGLLLGAPIHRASAQAQGALEYQLKAAFLFNFGQFVTWLPEALSDPQMPFVIGVLGVDPFGTALDDLVAGQTIQGRRTVVERYETAEEIERCHVLFISESETPRLRSIFAALSGRSILTVGEAPGFIERSGVIRFVVVDDRLRFEINTAAAEAASLTISSKLLRLAHVVRPADG